MLFSNKNTLVLLISSIIMMVWISHEVDAFCCPWHATTDLKCQCDDGVNVHPWECCSTGGCNVFCCNCGAPCRTNSTPSTTSLDERKRRDVSDIDDEIYLGPTEEERHLEAVNSALKFVAIDLNSDRQISFDEAEAYVYSQQPRQFRIAKASSAWFSSMDSDNDGSISPWEFDGSSGLTEEVVNWIETKRSGAM